MRKKFKVPSLVEDISSIPDSFIPRRQKNTLITETVPSISPPSLPSSVKDDHLPNRKHTTTNESAVSLKLRILKKLQKVSKFKLSWTPKNVSLLLGLIVVASLTSWQVVTAGRLVRLFQNPEKAAQHEIEQTMKDLNTLILLPQDEFPTIATVTDTSKLDQQPFFQYAENGDKVIMYPQARKAYLYRPSIKKLIEVAPLNVLDPSQAQTTPVELDTSSVSNQ